MMESTFDKNRRLPLLPLRGLLLYPSMVLHLDVGRDKSVKALEHAMLGDQHLLLCTQSEVNAEEPAPNEIFRRGTIAKIRQMFRLPNNTIRVLVEGVERAEIITYVSNNDFYEVQIRTLYDESITVCAETKAFMRIVFAQFEKYGQTTKKISPETFASISDIDHPGQFTDVIASHLSVKLQQKQELLETLNSGDRLRKLLQLLTYESEVIEIEKKIGQRVKKQMEKIQKEHVLREQMKAIQKELGEREGCISEIEELRLKVKEAIIPDNVSQKMNKEIERLEKMPLISAESAVIRHYIDWLLLIPWLKLAETDHDLQTAEAILAADHYGLEKVKERVLEYLAVKQLVKQGKGPILCFVGPPGVGKTSLACSIAKCMGRPFIRISLGGIRDEAEIRGHRRTYVGAMPGRIVQALKNAGTMNPVVLLDEIDKMLIDFRGDPAAALLEFLDPEQNYACTDHFIELPLDLSQVIFVTTANTIHPIPRPLLDRMELLSISGYTELEKLKIAQRYLLPKQRKNHGLMETQLVIDKQCILEIIRKYTCEAGVRQLEQQLAALCRKATRRIVAKKGEVIYIQLEQLTTYLGVPRYRYGIAEAKHQVGLATGLAWTEAGGDILHIEGIVVPGSGKLLLTGKLGDVMKESAQAAFSYIRSRTAHWNLAEDFYDKIDIHIHVPAGAIPKDGPSAGVTIAVAIVSALTNREVSKDIAMTGEITLRGRVLPVGGLKEKSLAALRAGIKTIMFPKDNEHDLKNIPDSVRQQVTFISVTHIEEVLCHALLEAHVHCL